MIWYPCRGAETVRLCPDFKPELLRDQIREEEGTSDSAFHCLYARICLKGVLMSKLCS